MATILEFPKPQPQKEPQIAGEAFCRTCSHEWVAVALVGTPILDCPECDAAKGTWKHTIYPPEGSYMFQCNCGSDIFRVTPEEIFCIMCGAAHDV